MKLTRMLAAACGIAMSAAAFTSASAAPVQLDLTGTVVDATGSRAADLGTAFSGSIVFDLDPANAFDIRQLTPAGEPPFYRWTFAGQPYQAAFSGNFGSFINPPDLAMWVETLDNIDTATLGNPFGITGIVDIFSLYGSGIVVDCSNGIVEPQLGCSDPNAPFLDGFEFGVHLVGASDWLSSDNMLPASIPDFANLIAVVGDGLETSNGVIAGDLAVVYSGASVSQVPVPAAAWLFGSGLLGLFGIARRRAS